MLEKNRRKLGPKDVEAHSALSTMRGVRLPLEGGRLASLGRDPTNVGSGERLCGFLRCAG